MKLKLAVFSILATLLITAALAGPGLAQNTVCYMQQGGATWIAGSGCTWNLKSGSTFTVDSGATFSVGGLTVYSTTRGASADLINNTLVAHGLGTTPTSILLTPFYAGSLTNTLYVSATNATSFTVGLAYPTQGVVTITNVYWEAIR